MKCEYCGSYLPVFPEGGTCPNCGATLPEPVKPNFPEPPLGIYSGVDSWLEIGKDSIRIRKEKILLTDYSDYEIPYEELTGVMFQPENGTQNGYLSLRCKLNQHTRFPHTLTDAQFDVTTVIVPPGTNAVFTQVHNFLWQCAAAEKAPGTLITPQGFRGRHYGVDGTLEIWDNCVCLAVEYLASKGTRYVIPYQDLYAVKFQEPGWMEGGYIKLRTWHNRRLDFLPYAYDREMTFRFKSDTRNEMLHAYRYLEECTRIANAAREKSK